MFERSHEPLLSRSLFALRLARFLAAAALIDLLLVALGAVGYRCLEGVTWLDAVTDAAMVMTGNGPITHLRTPGGKLFAVFDALVGQAVYMLVIAMLLTPFAHRVLHAFHLKKPERNIA